MPGNYIQFTSNALGETVLVYDVDQVAQFKITVTDGGIEFSAWDGTDFVSIGAFVKTGISLGQANANGVVTTQGDLVVGNILKIGASLAIDGALLHYDGGGLKILDARQASVDDATGAGDVVAQLNLALAALRAHGLIAP
jgi:hypothetical protein